MMVAFGTMLRPVDLPREKETPSAQPHQYVPVWIAAALLIGFIVRAVHIVSADFPLNDGGLFYVMVQELEHAHYRLPDFTSYNSLGIPFAYPPLGFYIAGVLDQLAPLSLIDIFRLLPLIVTTLTIVAFALLARDLLGGNTTTIAAVFAFALIPRSFIWLLMGGGVTRSFGFLFAILALHQVYRMYTRQSWTFFVPASLFGALTLMSHLGTAPFLAFSIALFFLAYGRHKHGVLSSIALGIGMLAVSAPWWATIVATHGFGPFLAANATGSSIFSDSDARRATLGWLAHLGVGSSSGGSTAEPLFPILGTLALLGALYSVSRKSFLLPAWWLTIIMFDTRAGATYAVVPVAMLAGLGITHVLLPVLTGSRDQESTLIRTNTNVHERLRVERRASWRSTLQPHWFTILLCVFIFSYAVLGAVSTKLTPASETRNLATLSKEERAAMRWVAATTPPSSRFVVVPENEWTGWNISKTSEWFPVLAERQSLGTVQGYEWLPNGGFRQQVDHFKVLRKCASSTVKCLDDWSRQTGMEFTHVYISQPSLSTAESYLLCCELLISSLKDDPRYELLYSGPGAVVFARR
ncbi:ArnT family glycosyltransferase [Nitrospira sp. Nam74]